MPYKNTPMVWYEFKGISIIAALTANCTDMPHDPNEIERLNPFDKKIPYDWSLKHG